MRTAPREQPRRQRPVQPVPPQLQPDQVQQRLRGIRREHDLLNQQRTHRQRTRSPANQREVQREQTASQRRRMRQTYTQAARRAEEANPPEGLELEFNPTRTSTPEEHPIPPSTGARTRQHLRTQTVRPSVRQQPYRDARAVLYRDFSSSSSSDSADRERRRRQDDPDYDPRQDRQRRRR